MAELTIDQPGALAPLVTAADGGERVAAAAVLIDVRSEAARRSAGELTGGAPATGDVTAGVGSAR